MGVELFKFVKLSVNTFRVNGDGWYVLNYKGVIADFRFLAHTPLDVNGPGEYFFRREGSTVPPQRGETFTGIFLKDDVERAGWRLGREAVFTLPDGDAHLTPVAPAPPAEFTQPLVSLTLGQLVLVNCSEGGGSKRYTGRVSAVDGDYFLLTGAATSGYAIDDLCEEDGTRGRYLEQMLSGENCVRFKRALLLRSAVTEIVFLED